VRPVPVTGFTQPLQINDFTTLYMLPLIPGLNAKEIKTLQ